LKAGKIEGRVGCVIDIAGGGLVSGDRHRRFLARLGNLVAQLNQAEQDFVALRLQFLDGARSDLGMDTVDELLLRFPASIAASWLCLRFGVAASIYVFRHSPIVRT
jgi:hypothetical protein